MLRQTGSKVCIFALAFTALVVAKPPPPGAPWASYVKPVYARALGPPFGVPGMGAISVPYKPKGSPFFPKFVDPTSMISKKTDMLSNLFGGLGPVDSAEAAPWIGAKYPPGFGSSTPLLYATSFVDETPEAKEAKEVNEVDKDTSKDMFRPSGYAGDATSIRRRRSIVGAGGEATKEVGPPPAYPGLAPIAEEPESLESKLLKLYSPASGVPKETLPGMFGPFGPFSPYAVPAAAGAAPFDPSIFIPKKPSFLDAFIASLATSTPPTDVVEPVTELPVPKSTIVPADFWAPSGIVPGPTEYTDKVSNFLDKLFSSLILNKTATAAASSKPVAARSLIEDPAKGKLLVSRSIEDIKNIAAAKDTIVDSILSELGDLKTNMIGTLDDYILYEKTLPVAKAPKKPLKKPFAAFFAPPTADPTLPFKQRMAVLSQVFDMLTGLQRNITDAAQAAIKSSTDAPAPDQPKVLPEDATATTDDAANEDIQDPSLLAIAAFNATLLDAIKSRLAALDKTGGTGLTKPFESSIYPAPVKRNLEDEVYVNPEFLHRDNNREQYKRAVQMQMHQGYQSMPPGTVESVQAGGGVVPGHQGGGIKLLDSQSNGDDWGKWSEWAEYFKNQNEGRKHHHNHH